MFSAVKGRAWLAVVMSVSAARAQAVSSVDLAAYFPTTTTQTRYKRASGDLYATYTYMRNPSALTPLYAQYFDLRKAGFLGVWSKHYGQASAPATYAQIFFGSDKSVTEVGDYLNLGAAFRDEFVLFGYRDTATLSNDGLRWTHPGGQLRVTNVVHPYNQGRAGRAFEFRPSDRATLAYAYVYAELVKEFRPDYGSARGVWARGNGQTYTNVLRVLFYHGTSLGNVGVDCSATPGNALKRHYAKVPGFASYVSEYYLAPGKWIVQERTLYIEDGSYWRNLGIDVRDCSGGAFDESKDGSFGASYIE
jgi:hypothetical protein